MQQYTILSYNFNGYDLLREPLIIDTNAVYKYVTDYSVTSVNWYTGLDSNLVNKNPIYSAYYVRYHPFEYVDTDIVVLVDASIQIKDSLEPIVKSFIDADADYAPMVTNYRVDENKINYWVSKRQFNKQEDVDNINKFMKDQHQEQTRGSIGQAFIIYRKSPKVIDYLEKCWDNLLKYGSYGVPNRFDEVIAHKTFNEYKDNIKIFPVSIQIIQSSYMDYNVHGKTMLIPKYPNYDQYYYFCNEPVKPYRFDKKIKFPTVWKYNTDAMLITKYLNEADLKEWIEHHLNCGFDHIQVFDNDSAYDVKSICDQYQNVDYEKVPGTIRQYQIYNNYVPKSEAKWIMPIDDEEYLSFSPEFKNIYEAICYYEKKFPHMNMLAVRWKHLFPKKFHSEREGNVLDYCTEENTELATKFMYLGDRTVKTIVKNYGEIHYEETFENPAGGHIPKNSTYFGAVLFNGEAVLGCGLKELPKDTTDEKIRLLHCRYKGYTDYTNKMKKCITISDKEHKVKHWAFDDMLDELE